MGKNVFMNTFLFFLRDIQIKPNYELSEIGSAQKA